MIAHFGVGLVIGFVLGAVSVYASWLTGWRPQ